MVQIVTATKAPRDKFLSDTALGSSIRRLLEDGRVSLRLWASNARGLPELYNLAIDAADTPETVIFVHDEDYYTIDRVVEGLQHFDIIGLAGSSYTPGQVRWGVPRGGNSGAVGHGRSPLGRVARFGPAPNSVDLLDGLFLAARTDTLRRSGVRFDESFKFHFYDLDFCLTARSAGLRLGVWPISVTHQSLGRFDSPEWKAASEVFTRKWQGFNPANRSDTVAMER